MGVAAVRENLAGTSARLSCPGCYSLIIELERPKMVCVGKLDAALFPKGIYVYTGSAMNGLARRLRRHCRRIKKTRWHIDHLLALPEARIKKIVIYPPAPGQECRQSQAIAALTGASIILKRFGATDCKRGCASHLSHFTSEAKLKFAAGSILRPNSLRARRPRP
jgi:Uri superfamily endonuclease